MEAFVGITYIILNIFHFDVVGCAVYMLIPWLIYKLYKEQRLYHFLCLLWNLDMHLE